MVKFVGIDKIKIKYGSIKQKDNLIRFLTKSIEKYGQLYPVLVNQDYEIINGHNIYEMLKKLGYSEIQVNIIDTTNINEKQLYLELHFTQLELNPIQAIKYIKDIDMYNNCLYLTSEELSNLQLYLHYDIKDRPKTNKEGNSKVRKVKKHIFKENERLF